MADVIKLKVIYGSDAHGFYWPGSPAKRKEIMSVKRGKPAVFESTYQGRPGKRIGSIFKREDFMYFDGPENLALGLRNPLVRDLVKSYHTILQCWDTAFSSTESSANSACITAGIRHCNHYHNGEDPDIYGECEAHFDIDILHVFMERLEWGGLIKAVKEQYYKWLPETVLIENRASGISLIQTLPVAGVPIKGVSTGSQGKGARAINAVDEKAAGTAEGWYTQRRVAHAIGQPWLEDFETEMIDFTGKDDGSADRVDATVHLITDVILRGLGTMTLPTGFGDPPTPRQMAEDMTAVQERVMMDDPRGIFLNFLGHIGEMSEDPFYSNCGNCKLRTGPEGGYGGFCNVQQRAVSSLDSCEFFHPAKETQPWLM